MLLVPPELWVSQPEKSDLLLFAVHTNSFFGCQNQILTGRMRSIGKSLPPAVFQSVQVNAVCKLVEAHVC